MMKKSLQFILILSAFAVGLFFVADAQAASQWVTNPATCSINDPINFPGQNCTPQRICGDNSGIAQCYDTSLIGAPVASAISDTKYDSSRSAGGYLLNCYAAMDGSAPQCDNGGALWCNRDDTCHDTNHKVTQCTGGVFGASTCGAACVSGYQDCDATPAVCEVQTGSTNCAVGSNNNIGASCTCQCDSGYVDCNASGAGVGDGCEIQVGGSCVGGGGLAGTWNSSCTCVVPSQHFIAGTNAYGATTSPLLWGTQLGSGDLVNISQNGSATSTFVISNSGQMGIGLTTVSVSAAMEVSSTDKGVLLPRLTTSQRNAIGTTPDGLIIYNIDSHRFEYYNSASSTWQGMGDGGASITYTAGDGLSLAGNEFRIRINSTLTTSTGILGLATSGVASGTYGSPVEIPVFTVDAYGRIVSAGTTTIYISDANITGTIAIAHGGTGATNTLDARINLGLGTSAVLNSDYFIWNTSSLQSANFNVSGTGFVGGQFGVGTTTMTSTLKARINGRLGVGMICDEDGENCKNMSDVWGEATSWRTTTALYDGNIVTSTLQGYQAANAICAANFSGHHFCTTEDLMSYIKLTSDLSAFGSGALNTWVANGPPGYLASANDCEGWTSDADTSLGAIWIYNSNGGGKGYLTACDQNKPLSCCK